MKVHELKILPEYFDAVRRGDKRFELRRNDREFHRGDILRLKEWDGKQYTGEVVDVLVRYIYHGIDEYGLAEGYCILSIDTMMHYIPRKNGEWIPVSERLPEDGSDILAYYDNGIETRITACNYYKGEWFDCVFNTETVFKYITHWMPLPKPPKKEGETD